MTERLEEMGPRTKRAVERSLREFAAGKYKTLDEVKRMMGF